MDGCCGLRTRAMGDKHRRFPSRSRIRAGVFLTQIRREAHLAVCDAIPFYSKFSCRCPTCIHQELSSCIYHEESTDRRFDWFVATTRKIAGEFKESGHSRVLSGTAKLMFLRYPLDGFVYDSLARKALWNCSLRAEPGPSLHMWGGDPYDNAEKTFLRFAAAFKKFCRPLVQPLAEALEECFREVPRSARIVDKVLWISALPNKKRDRLLAGGCRANDEDKKIADAGCRAAQTMLGGQIH